MTKMKYIYTGMLAVFIAGMLTACNNINEAPAVSNNAAEEAGGIATEEPGGPEDQEIPGGQTLRIAMNTEPDNLDPYVSAASDTEAIMLNVFEGLTWTDENGAIIPGLARQWRISENGLEYTFDLHEDVYFHNGQEFSADDVVFSISRLAGLDGGDPASSKFEDVAGIEKLGDFQVKITLNQRDASFLGKCMKAILPRDYNDQGTFPVGTGPYRFVSYNPGQSMKLTINEVYYKEDRRGSIENVEFMFMSDENAKLLALRSGSIDIFDAASEIIDQVPEEGFEKYHSLSNTVQIFALNNERAPFDDIRVRQALNYAVNREELNQLVTGGMGTVIYTTMTPAMPVWYNSETENYYSYDPEKAIALLSEAGYPNGFDMELSVGTNYYMNVNAAQVIAHQLEAVNINVTIQQMEFGYWMEEVYTNANYESTVVGLTGKVEPHDIFYRFYSAYPANFYNYNNDLYDIFVEEGYMEEDVTARKEIYNAAQMLLTEDAAAVFLIDPGSDVACMDRLKGYVSYPITFWDLSSFYFE